MRKLRMDELGRKSVAGFKEAEKLPLVVVLDNVRSMHNVGSVFRTADAFLAEEMMLCGYTPLPPHRDIHKTALGATDTVKWRHVERAADAVAELIRRGYRVLAVEQTTPSIPLPRFNWDGTQPLAVVFGNEVEGVGDEVLALCQGSLEIPQLGSKHSVNISVAAGIVLYKLAEIRLC